MISWGVAWTNAKIVNEYFNFYDLVSLRFFFGALSLIPILLFLIPRFFANFAMWGITQHTGLKGNVKDHRVTTRSIRLNPIFSFIYWKMEYHVEHHMFPMIPSYNLPKLYEVIKDQLPKPKTLFAAHKEIFVAVLKRRKDPSYYIHVELPNS